MKNPKFRIGDIIICGVHYDETNAPEAGAYFTVTSAEQGWVGFVWPHPMENQTEEQRQGLATSWADGEFDLVYRPGWAIQPNPQLAAEWRESLAA